MSDENFVAFGERWNADTIRAAEESKRALGVEAVKPAAAVDEGMLKPCPFCGSSNLHKGSDLYPFYIYCSNCLAKGPHEGPDNYGEKWNIRK